MVINCYSKIQNVKKKSVSYNLENRVKESRVCVHAIF